MYSPAICHKPWKLAKLTEIGFVDGLNLSLEAAVCCLLVPCQVWLGKVSPLGLPCSPRKLLYLPTAGTDLLGTKLKSLQNARGLT